MPTSHRRPTRQNPRRTQLHFRTWLPYTTLNDRPRSWTTDARAIGGRTQSTRHVLSGDSDVATVRIHRMSGRTPMNGSPAAHVSGVYGISLSRLGLVCGAIALLAARLLLSVLYQTRHGLTSQAQDRRTARANCTIIRRQCGGHPAGGGWLSNGTGCCSCLRHRQHRAVWPSMV